jgi:hypothetical protein
LDLSDKNDTQREGTLADTQLNLRKLQRFPTDVNASLRIDGVGGKVAAALV